MNITGASVCIHRYTGAESDKWRKKCPKGKHHNHILGTGAYAPNDYCGISPMAHNVSQGKPARS
jgi:hypothetical protein